MNPASRPGLLTVDDTGAVSWWGSGVAAVATVDIPAGQGVSVRVDAAFPDVPLAWTVPPGTPSARLAAIFDDPPPPELLDELRRDGATVRTLRAQRLTSPWRHRALTAAVARWTVHTVDNGALLIDLATAEYLVGRNEVAGRLFAHARTVFADLAERALDGELPAAAIDLLASAAGSAAELGVGGEFVELAADLGTALGGTPEAIAEPPAPGAVSAATLSGGEEATDMDHGAVDLALVPPRILAWHGPRGGELLIEHHRDRDVFVVTAALARRVDPQCAEVAGLLAYANDVATGGVVAVGPTRVTGRTVVAELPANGHVLGARRFGLFGHEIDVVRLPAGSFGRALADVNREAVAAWNNHRAAQAARIAGMPGDVTADLMLAAETAAYNAREDVLGIIAGPIADHDPEAVRICSARAAALDEYLASLTEPGESGASLLAELVVPQDYD